MPSEDSDQPVHQSNLIRVFAMPQSNSSIALSVLRNLVQSKHATWRLTCTQMTNTTGVVSRKWIQPPHDKTNNVAVRPAKTQISLGIRPV